jgi:hypothetical protein
MATTTQVSRLEKVERTVPKRDPYDLSELSDFQLKVLKRFVRKESSEEDIHIMKTEIGPIFESQKRERSS